MWNKKEINAHAAAATALDAIVRGAFAYIAKTRKAAEYDVQQYILGEYRRLHMRVDKDPPIVGFGAHSAIPHYFPEKKGSARLTPNTLVLIDVWSRFNKGHSPFADSTWVGFYGSTIPAEVKRVYRTVIAARDAAVDYVSKELKRGRLPTGMAVDQAAMDIIERAGYKKYILHRTGHCIGFESPHGNSWNVNQKNPHPLSADVGYTIEPGVYLKGKFGVRSEIDFYIDANRKLHITTPVQREMVRI
jgi:Xaa-Pro aminopeptidase